MAYPASKKVSYVGQFGILAGFTGAGLIISFLAFTILLAGKVNFAVTDSAAVKAAIESLYVPENAGIVRLLQFVQTLFIFFLPALVYAKICHSKPFTHLGHTKSVTLRQAFLVVLIMGACLPIVGVLSDVIDALPFSEAAHERFEKAEEAFQKSVEAIGRMENTWDFILSLFMLAIFPAFFEETMFRGALQNLLSRWWKLPLLAIIITSLFFSFIHFSYLGFLSRAFLGFVLGWMYHRTGNLWLSIIGHAANNVAALTAFYIMKSRYPDKKMDEATEFPVLSAVLAVFFVVWLFNLLDKASRHQIERPGEEEVLVKEIEDPFNKEAR